MDNRTQNSPTPEGTPMPEPQQPEKRALQPERAAVAKPEMQQPRVERQATAPEQAPVPQAQPVQPPAQPPVSSAPPPTNTPDPLQLAGVKTNIANLPAEDTELIEKEWVDTVDDVIEHTKDDPHTEEEAQQALSKNYLKKRFGVDVE